ncbi:tRNA synthetases class I, catalytic domain [Roseomonas mucosa]|uniref:Glutamate--tRNA ligase n=3 Tax=Roseomonas TaxID=125216 RepID=A0A1S8D8M7_9PROT|nr:MULTISPECIES: tRNA glutamyl-Q(34) synthetase GluQRS [Roseomonas]MBS5903476.1 tRNA glutamyl-Q(34) synthetase GluQRS [Acetobacteraceae bacterium]MDT8265483.1 tRNA glutamyl-Q(34) synthetase GluQRS [Roseomonas sp. DSM 102946]ATR20876.1 tRNA glutamyl-Q(34) synthetase GluQRS [Roseomonas sp. FDAARGOS_362]MCG7350315.1 tRNA glutamyl-Q(34) synthetase GluQRS [Roseomonas mucosa]MCG7358566.1 tRNA glutamyl-Q(34) synthetase GluQRS [Roseomonas mucosa]
MTAEVVTRFAPSPTGYLHLGHVRSALQGWRAARRAGGRFLLRIEDIDPTRCRPEYRAAIGEDLRALGLDWNGPVRVQSEHLPEYRLVLNSLARRGLLYPCFCTRAEIAREIAHSGAAPHPGEAGPEGPAYPGTCRRLDPAERARRLSAGEPHALRLDMPAALATLDGPLSYAEQGHGRVRCDPARFGDAVLARKDAPASYHLCVTHDDALQGVTLVTRGEDLRAATDIHRLLQALMGWPEPRYAHHPLLLGPDGKRLAKRDGAKPVRQLLREGLSPREILALAEGSPAGGATPAA